MLLHIIPGDKFEHYAAEQFETVLPGGNRFVVVLPKGASVSEARESGGFDYERVVVGTGSYGKLLDEVSSSECIVFHGFHPYFMGLLERCPPSCVTAWVPWGFETYGLGRFSLGIMQPLTARCYVDMAVERRWVRRLAKRLLGPFFPGMALLRLANLRGRLHERRYIAALRRFDYVLTHMDEEVELIHRQGLSDAEHLPFCYGSLERTVGEGFKHMHLRGSDILLGNSAALSNNHLDAIEKLRAFDLDGRRVFCPLAYGGASFGDALAEAGRVRLGDAFVPLMEFMPLDEYNNILSRCGVIVMNHERQQAMGNIITALWLGAKLYLNETTTVWRYLRRIGIKAYSISVELRPENPVALDPPPDEVVEQNREVLLREFSYDRALGYCRGIVAELKRRGVA